jgi:hypothetical protein
MLRHKIRSRNPWRDLIAFVNKKSFKELLEGTTASVESRPQEFSHVQWAVGQCKLHWSTKFNFFLSYEIQI